jgi:hypothetical protein
MYLSLHQGLSVTAAVIVRRGAAAQRGRSSAAFPLLHRRSINQLMHAHLSLLPPPSPPTQQQQQQQ